MHDAKQHDRYHVDDIWKLILSESKWVWYSLASRTVDCEREDGDERRDTRPSLEEPSDESRVGDDSERDGHRQRNVQDCVLSK